MPIRKLNELFCEAEKTNKCISRDLDVKKEALKDKKTDEDPSINKGVSTPTVKLLWKIFKSLRFN